jgi:hypothetical protein
MFIGRSDKEKKEEIEFEVQMLIYFPILLPDYASSKLNEKMWLYIVNSAECYDKFDIEDTIIKFKHEDMKLMDRTYTDYDCSIAIYLIKKFSMIPGHK